MKDYCGQCPPYLLAEAQITQFDSFGHPIAATLLLDTDANGLGWFIDNTPWENSEFTTQTTETAYKSTPGSAAYGHYDLLTTILHELGHIAGFISGNPNFDSHIQTLNNAPVFAGNGFTAALTSDRSHLTLASDLMSPYLAPGMRKLPSAIDLQILNAIQQSIGQPITTALSAPQHSTPLIGITDGTFDTPDTWETRGAINLLNGQATLTERSSLLSNLIQTFLIPQGTKALQFEILNADLDASDRAPGDAFKAALLDVRNLTPLIAPTTGLSQTDAFLNLQHTGKTYLSDKVTIASIATHTRLVTVGLSTVTANTLATLSFDLLGFGTREGSVTIDNVRLLNRLPPIAQADSATTTQSKAIALNLLSNDSLTHGNLQLVTTPTHGAIALIAQAFSNAINLAR